MSVRESSRLPCPQLAGEWVTADAARLARADKVWQRTNAMMQLSETGFREWGEPGEDIYDAEA